MVESRGKVLSLLAGGGFVMAAFFRTHRDPYFHLHPMHSLFALIASAALAALVVLILATTAR